MLAAFDWDLFPLPLPRRGTSRITWAAHARLEQVSSRSWRGRENEAGRFPFNRKELKTRHGRDKEFKDKEREREHPMQRTALES